MIRHRASNTLMGIAVLWIWLCSAAAFDSVTILNHGNPANRINIVFVGDGFQVSELAQYASTVQGTINHIFSQTPFREYKSYFNIYRVDVISNESGADHPDLGRFVDTALDSSYSCAGIQRLICSDGIKVFDAVGYAPVAADIIFVVVNDPDYGGSGGSFSVFSTHAAGSELALHEIGHSFGGLADEYFSPMLVYNGMEPSAPNVTIQTDWANVKWNHWIDPFTSVPTFQMTDGVPGLYEGAQYYEFDIYRPTPDSKMRTLGKPFESVNAEQLVLRTYDRVSPIDQMAPLPGVVTIPPGQEGTFTVEPMQPTHKNMLVEWYLDDISVGENPVLTLQSAGLNGGINQLRVEVTDASPLVRHDPANLLMDSVSWVVTDGPVIGSLSDQTILEGQLLQFDVHVTDETSVTLSARRSNGQVLSSFGANFVDHGNSTGTFSWTPADGQGGMDYFIEFIATDQNNLTDVVTARITVQRLVADMISPVSGSILASSTVDFHWTGDRPTAWWLDMGSSVGAVNYFDSGPLGGALSTTVTNLPTDGSTVFVRLWYFLSGNWLSKDFQYQAASSQPAISTPASGSTLTGAAVSFRWLSNGASISNWWVYVGSSVGGSSYFSSGLLAANTLSMSITGLPTDGSKIFVTLWYWTATGWRETNFEYTSTLQ